jgi:hypothetical protein
VRLEGLGMDMLEAIIRHSLQTERNALCGDYFSPSIYVLVSRPEPVGRFS